MHVLEPPDLWQRYIDPAWKHAAPVGLTELRRDMRVKLKSSVVLRIGTVRPQRGDAAGPWSCVGQLGFKAIFLAPGCVARRPWHDPYSDPLWAECERLGIPVTFHGGGQTYLKPDFSLEVLDKLVMWHTFGQPLGVMFVAVSLCAGGV